MPRKRPRKNKKRGMLRRLATGKKPLTPERKAELKKQREEQRADSLKLKKK